MYKDTPNIIKIITAFILALTGFLLFPKEAEAYGSPGYGWGKMEWSTGAENTHIYTTRDADTGALISTDKLNIFVTGPGAFPGSYVEYHCAASCPPTVTLTGIPSGVRVDFYGSAEKAGYSSTSNPGAFRIDPPGLDGNNVLTLNTYLTRVGIPPRGEAVFPAPLWYDYVPSPVIRVYPSFGASQAWVRWGADRYGPYSAPFPQEATIPPVAAWTDGWAGGGLTIEDELGFRSSDVGFGFGLDRSAPIVSCSISPSGIITYPTNVAVTLNESDTLSGIAEGDVDVRVGGGPWENTGLPSSGNTTNDFTYAASGNGTYEFRYRARDNTINSAGVGDQWSDYVSCGVVTIAVPSPTCSVDFLPSNSTLDSGDTQSMIASILSQGNGSIDEVRFSSNNTGIVSVAPQTVSHSYFDAASSASSQASSYSWLHTVGQGNDRLLLVGVSLRDGAPVDTVSSIIYAGQNFTFIGARNDPGGGLRVEFWRLTNPQTGSKTITVNLTGSAGSVSGATSWVGVDQTNPAGLFASATGFSQNPSVNVLGNLGEMVVDVLVRPDGGAGIVTPGLGQTELWNKVQVPGDIRGVSSNEVGASDVTMSWTMSNEAWVMGGVSIKPASGSSFLGKYITTATGGPETGTATLTTDVYMSNVFFSHILACSDTATVDVLWSPWFQTQGGDVHSQQNIYSKIPSLLNTVFSLDLFPLDAVHYPGVVSYGGSSALFGTSEVSSRGWLPNSSYLPAKYNYDYFYRRLGVPTVDNFSCDSGCPTPLAGETKTYYSIDNVLIDGANSWTIKDNTKVMVLVNGDLNISLNPNSKRIRVEEGSFLAFFVKGNINIDGNVGIKQAGVVEPFIQGIYIADGQIDTYFNKDDDDMGVKSGFRFIGAGLFYAKGGVKFTRKLKTDCSSVCDANTPAELFIFRPDLVLNSPRELWSGQMNWIEVAP